MKMTKDIYFNSGHLTGGSIADIKKPHVRYFPNPFRKRKVTITISRYYGYGPHYYVSIDEEDNPIWNGNNKEWVIAFDDDEGKGRSDLSLYLNGDNESRIREDSYNIALGKAKMLIKKYFQNHEVVWNDYCKSYEGLGDENTIK